MAYGVAKPLVWGRETAGGRKLDEVVVSGLNSFQTMAPSSFCRVWMLARSEVQFQKPGDCRGQVEQYMKQNSSACAYFSLVGNGYRLSLPGQCAIARFRPLGR